jgi:hypothetical protein
MKKFTCVPPILDRAAKSQMKLLRFASSKDDVSAYRAETRMGNDEFPSAVRGRIVAITLRSLVALVTSRNATNQVLDHLLPNRDWTSAFSTQYLGRTVNAGSRRSVRVTSRVPSSLHLRESSSILTGSGEARCPYSPAPAQSRDNGDRFVPQAPPQNAGRDPEYPQLRRQEN